MNFKERDIVKLENGDSYLIVKIIEDNNNKYLYLSNISKINFALVKVVNQSDKITLNQLDDEEYNKVIELLAIK